MPYRARQEFTKKTGYEFSDNTLIDRISNVGRSRNTLEEIEENAIASMRNLIAEDAAKHERRRQEAQLRALAHPKSKRLLKAADALANQTRFVQEYVGLCEKIVKATKLSQRKTVDDLLPNFGLTGEDFVGMMREQLNSYTYREGRRFQLFHAVGIKSQKFSNELSGLEFDFGKKKVEYSTAGEDDKAKIHEVYVTKDLVETRLNEKSGWWKFWHPGQTKAMKAYLDKANTFLDTVQFPKPVPDEAKAFANQGYEFAKLNRKNELEAEFARIAKEVDSKLSESRAARETKSAEKRAKLEEQRKQEMERQAKLDAAAKEKALQEAEAQKQITEKLAPSKDEADRVRGMELKDQFFQIRFRPSLDNTITFEKQNNVLKELAKSDLIKGKHLPKDVKLVFNMNFQKMQNVKTLLRDKIPHMTNDAIEKSKNNLLSSFVDVEEKLQQKLPDYKPQTLEQLETNWKLQQQLQVDTGAKENAPQEVAPKHEELVVQKEMGQKEIN